MVNLTYNQNRILPTAEELPSSDETPVDNQLQNDIPNLLLSLLALIWANRDDWYFLVTISLFDIFLHLRVNSFFHHING
jgi:Uma2 family endonuclease